MEQTVLRTTQLSDEEICRLGHELYERDLKHKLEPEHNGEHITIHVANGDYAVGPDALETLEKMREKYPDDVFYGAKVGSRAAYKLRSPRLR